MTTRLELARLPEELKEGRREKDQGQDRQQSALPAQGALALVLLPRGQSKVLIPLQIAMR